jgi:hypothetical protein
LLAAVIIVVVVVEWAIQSGEKDSSKFHSVIPDVKT